MMGDNADFGGGLHIAGQNTQFGSVTYDVGGEQVVPLFTSERRVSEAFPKGLPPGTSSIRMDARTFLEAFSKGTKFVLNPASSFGKELVADEVAALLDGSIFEPPPQTRYAAGADCYLRVPPRVPQKAVEAFASYFRTSGSVERAHVAEICVPSTGEPPHLIVGIILVERPSKSFAQLASELGLVAPGVLGKDELIDFYEIGKKAGGPIEEFLIQTEPFYRRLG